MKSLLTLFAFSLISSLSYGQRLMSGEYEFGLRLSYDEQTKILTGYFENYTGWDNDTKQPKFSCIFYIKGKAESNKINIVTFYPEDTSDTINGLLEIVNDSLVNIKLNDEHGGCWNVLSFANKPVDFKLIKKTRWKELKYVTANKAFFHNEPSNRKRQNAYLLKNDFVSIDKLQGLWAYCRFSGKRITKGWMKLSELNK